MVEQVTARFGRIDVLDNNAASLELTAQDPDVAALDQDILVQTLRGNLIAPLLMCRHVIPVMIENGGDQ